MIDVLIVEHDAQLQKILQDRLKAYPFMKFDIHVAENAEDALYQAVRKPPQVVVLDAVTEGEINGYEATRRLRNHPNTHAVKILLMSVLDDQMNETMALRAGADAYLVKNASTQKLHEALDTMLNSQ